MLEFNRGAQVYIARPENDTSHTYYRCTGCAFENDSLGCDESQLAGNCGINHIIWVKKASEPIVQDAPKDKQVEYSFEDKLRELLHQEASKGRLVESISVRSRTMDGKPTTMHIEYESHGA